MFRTEMPARFNSSAVSKSGRPMTRNSCRRDVGRRSRLCPVWRSAGLVAGFAGRPVGFDFLPADRTKRHAAYVQGLPMLVALPQRNGAQDPMFPTGQPREHVQGVLEILRLAQDGPIRYDCGVGRQHRKSAAAATPGPAIFPPPRAGHRLRAARPGAGARECRPVPHHR